MSLTMYKELEEKVQRERAEQHRLLEESFNETVDRCRHDLVDGKEGTMEISDDIHAMVWKDFISLARAAGFSVVMGQRIHDGNTISITIKRLGG